MLPLAGATTIETIGGSTGEVAGRVVAGQEMDVAEIGFEGIAVFRLLFFRSPHIKQQPVR